MDWNLAGYFVHGLIFFTLALSVALVSYQSHLTVLAKRQSWLGIFAACEALFAWGTLITRMVAAETAPQITPLWIASLALGYIFLLAFGIQTFRAERFSPAEEQKLLIALNAAWGIPFMISLAVTYPHWSSIATNAETLIRCCIGFPAGLTAAVGLRRQSYQSLDPGLRRRIRHYLRLGELTLMALGAFNLMLTPATPLWRWLRLSPAQVARLPIEWLWVGVGIGLTLGWGRSLTAMQREIEHWLEGIERLQMLAADRERIGRDLHDGIIQSIYASGLLLESIVPVIPQDPSRAQAQVGRVLDNLNHTIQDIRRYIFDLRSDIVDEEVHTGIERLLRDFRVNTLLETELEISGTPVDIVSIERRRHIFQIVREALANTARHARAHWVKVHLVYNEGSLDLIVSDDGIGMETLLIGKGYGLRNIRERARLLDGVLRVESAPGEGVTFHLTVPYS